MYELIVSDGESSTRMLLYSESIAFEHALKCVRLGLMVSIFKIEEALK